MLPLSFDENGVCHALLGEEKVKGHTCFCDFGGRREALDASPIETAARECSEESLGIIFSGSYAADVRAVQASTLALISILSDAKMSVSVIQKFQRGGCYHQFFALVRWTTDSVNFKCALDSQAHQPMRGAEKTSIIWLPFDLLINAAMREERRNVVSWRGRQIVLRPCFGRSLILAAASEPLRSLIQSGMASLAIGSPSISLVLTPQDPKPDSTSAQDLNLSIFSRSISYTLSHLKSSNSGLQ